MKRLFTAMPFESADFQLWYEEIQQQYPQFKWYPAADLHITLQFLGSVPDNLQTSIEQKLNNIKLGINSIEFTTTKPQAFYKNGKPFVVWMGLKPNQLIQDIYQQSSQLLRGLYQDRQIEFIPHITLFRTKSAQEPAVRDFLNAHDKDLNQSGIISNYCLYEVDTQKDGRYKRLKSFNLS